MWKKWNKERNWQFPKEKQKQKMGWTVTKSQNNRICWPIRWKRGKSQGWFNQETGWLRIWQAHSLNKFRRKAGFVRSKAIIMFQQTWNLRIQPGIARTSFLKHQALCQAFAIKYPFNAYNYSCTRSYYSQFIGRKNEEVEKLNELLIIPLI